MIASRKLHLILLIAILSRSSNALQEDISNNVKNSTSDDDGTTSTSISASRKSRLDSNYDQLHKFAINEQVINYRRAQKSLNTRHVINLDGLVDFCLDDGPTGFAMQWYGSSLKQNCRDGNFYKMPIPSAFNNIVPNKTLHNYVGWMWYQTTIDLDELTKGSQDFSHRSSSSSIFKTASWWLQFESVNYLAVVFLHHPSDAETNVPSLKSSSSTSSPLWSSDAFVGSHVGGYLPFGFDITDRVLNYQRRARRYNKPNQTNKQNMNILRLTIAVNNRLTTDTIPSGNLRNVSAQVGRCCYEKFDPDFDFFHYAGVLGSVNLVKLNRQLHWTHVEQVPCNKDERVNLCFEGCANNLIAYPTMVEATLTLASNQLLIGHATNESQTTIGTKCVRISFEICDDVMKKYAWRVDSAIESFQPLIEAKFKLQVMMQPASGAETTTNKTLKRRKKFAKLKTVDTYELRIGLDSAQNFDTKRGLVAPDGSRVPIRGFGMHMEDYFGGRTMSRPAILRDLYQLKQTGANTLRTSHYPYSSEYLDACDELGIGVIAECAAVSLKKFTADKLKLHKQLLMEMLHRDNHHPSIIMWSIANEPQSQRPESDEYFANLTEFARTNEMSRYTVDARKPLTAAIAQSWKDDHLGQHLDVIMVNRYVGWYECLGLPEAIGNELNRTLSAWMQRHPNKGVVMSEFGADTVSGLHSSIGAPFSEEYQTEIMVEHERVFSELYGKNGSMFWGSMLWNFADFSTYPSLMRVGGNRKGIFDRSREPKLAAMTLLKLYKTSTSVT